MILQLTVVSLRALPLRRGAESLPALSIAAALRFLPLDGIRVFGTLCLGGVMIGWGIDEGNTGKAEGTGKALAEDAGGDAEGIGRAGGTRLVGGDGGAEGANAGISKGSEVPFGFPNLACVADPPSPGSGTTALRGGE